MDTKLNVLVVDDFATMRRIIIGTLKELGFTNIQEADDGKNALTVLKSNKVDFIITDWNMPEMTGIELLKAVRADEKMSKLPVLLVTAEAKKDQIIEAVKSGVNGYIVKPFNANTLREKLEKILGS